MDIFTSFVKFCKAIHFLFLREKKISRNLSGNKTKDTRLKDAIDTYSLRCDSFQSL